MADRPDAKNQTLGSTITNSATPPTRAGGDDESAFAPGEVIAQRHRIVRLIAHGGMGAVYEAEDLSLQQRVALKTIRPERNQDHRAVERFKREALLARRVTHRNVCRVFDVGHHGRELFLTMELLDGETLASRIRHEGPLPPDEALPLVDQMVAALAEAHHAGVVHRDFKCSNVMVARDRVVVTDFGLAHDATDEDHQQSREGFIGSPAYVAPEQVGGHHVSFASDIYSLGVVLFEMVTGRLPFIGATPMATAVLRLNEDPPAARTYAPELPEAWNATIARCLRRAPEERFACVEDVLRALRGETVAGGPVTGRVRRSALVALVVALVIGAAAAGWRWSHSRTLATADGRRTAAVLDLHAAGGGGGGDAWRASAFADLLSAQLTGGELRTLPRELLVRRRLSSDDTPDALSRLHDNGAQLAITGAWRQAADALTFTVRVVDTRTGRILGEVEESGAPSALFDVAGRTAGEVRRLLGVSAPSPAETQRIRSALPSNPAAAKLYTDGLGALRRFEPRAAQQAFEAALAIDGDQPMVYAALAAAWHDLGADQREREAAQHAFDRAGNLSREDRLTIEAAYREALNDWAGAAQIRLTLATFFPDNLEYGLKLAAAQRHAGRDDDARATLDRLRQLPPPDGDDPRIDLAEADAKARKDAPGALIALRKAVDRATRRGALGVVGDARILECWVEGNSMHVDAAEAACRQAIKLFTEEGNRAGVARATVELAELYILARRNDEARALERDVDAIYREIGSRMGEVRARMLMAVAYKHSGDSDTAERLWREVIEACRAADEPHLLISAMDSLAGTLTDMGRHDEALPYYRQVIETAHNQGLPAIEANSMSNFSINLTRIGKLDEARRFADGAVALWRKLGQKGDVVFGMDSVEQIALRQGRLADAQEAAEQALAMREGFGWIGGPSRQNLAEVTMVQGNLPRAEALARKAVEEFRSRNERLNEQFALDILIRILVKEHRVGDAAAAMARADEIQRQTGGRSLIVGSQSMVKAAQGDAPAAISALRGAIAENDKKGDVDVVMDQRQILAEILLDHGSRDDARQAVASLRREAAAHGYKQALKDAAALERKLR